MKVEHNFVLRKRLFLPRIARLTRLMCVFAALCASMSCKLPPRSLNEDIPRRAAPIPACVWRDPQSMTTDGSIIGLEGPDYWALVYPSFDRKASTLAQGARDCTGRDNFATQELRYCTPANGWPLNTGEGQMSLGGGPDQLRVVWLWEGICAGGLKGGALALIRNFNGFAEVYAIAPFRALPERMKFAVQRMGPEVVVTAEDTGCPPKKAGEPPVACETLMTMFLPRKGRLVMMTRVPIKRVGLRMEAQAASSSAPGEEGAETGEMIEYDLTTTVTYLATGVSLVEEMVVLDSGGRQLRAAQLDRTLTLHDDESGPAMLADTGPLWERLFDRKEPATP